MKCQGKFKFRGLQKKDGGTFTNSRGEIINYKESYALKVDEQTEQGTYERVFKLPIDCPLVNELSQREIYSDIILQFDIVFYSSGAKVIPIALAK